MKGQEKNVLCTLNGILFGLKKKYNSDTCYNMNEPWKQHARWNEDKYCMTPFMRDT